MNIPYTAIEPFEPLGIPVLTNKRATLDDLIRRVNALSEEIAERKLYAVVPSDNPFYEQLKGDS